jgi:hypothetical protein
MARREARPPAQRQVRVQRQLDRTFDAHHCCRSACWVYTPLLSAWGPNVASEVRCPITVDLHHCPE